MIFVRGYKKNKHLHLCKKAKLQSQMQGMQFYTPSNLWPPYYSDITDQ